MKFHQLQEGLLCRDVIWLVMIKASGALIWMAADVLNVKFSEMPSMQLLGDQPFTLGLIFASVGFGCFLGPIVFNYFTPPRYSPLLLLLPPVMACPVKAFHPSNC